MQLVFDRGLSTEKSLRVDTVNERVTENHLNASLNLTLTERDNIPNVKAFSSEPDFTTVEIFDGDSAIPVNGHYNHIAALNVTYSTKTHQYNLNVTLTYETPAATEPEAEEKEAE